MGTNLLCLNSRRNITGKLPTQQPTTRQERREVKAIRRLRRSLFRALRRYAPGIALVAILLVLTTEASHAQTILDRVVDRTEQIILGRPIRLLAMLAIVLAGVGLALGRTSGEMFLTVLIGCCLILGSSGIVTYFFGV